MEIRWTTSKCEDERLSEERDRLAWMQVGPLTNENATQCLAEHLTPFASSFAFLPAAIDWSRAFAHADFISNPTIYSTVIVVVFSYIVLMIYARRFDGRDLQRVSLIASSLFCCCC